MFQVRVLMVVERIGSDESLVMPEFVLTSSCMREADKQELRSVFDARLCAAQQYVDSFLMVQGDGRKG